MAMTDLPLVSMLRDRMQWHQARQKVLAENVANANTPGFVAQDLVATRGGRSVAATPPGGFGMTQTSPLHLAGTAGTMAPDAKAAGRFETRPSGTAVSLEDEMLKVADNQADYQLAASLYQKSLAMLRAAASVRGA